MRNSLRRFFGKSLLVRVIVSTVAVTALLLLVLLAAASANTEFFDRYYSWLYTANILVALVFLLVVMGLVGMIVVRLRKGKFGTRLLAKLAVFFALVGVVPGGIIYIVSYQFVSRSIESWFDVNVETALTAGLNLGRDTLDASLSDLRSKARLMSEQLASADTNTNGTTLTLLRLRDQFGVQDATIVEPGRNSTGAAPDLHIVAQASGNFAALIPDDMPTSLMMSQAREHGGYAAIEGEVDGDPTAKGAKGALRLRVVQRIPDSSTALLQPVERYLQLTQPVSPTLARNADAVQRAYREYQEKSLGRSGLRKMYIGTLTLALFLATFIAMMIALALGNQLARPLFLLAQGTKEVAEGDYTPKRELKTRDELGFLTQSFNAMTRQLSEARLAVERNRVALEYSKSYLESILANLTAGVFVLDRQFRLTIANRGAERIFRQPFQSQIGTVLDQLAVVAEFGAMVRKAFADREAAGQGGGEDRGHWQQQFAVMMPGETDPLTLLVRGTRLASAVAGEADDPQTAGYVVVFDDISDVISAQRS
ncbi:MAG: HAMP domain-containing protein, partial [Burkholderia sp.]